MKRLRSIRGFASGLIVGLLLGSAGFASATFGPKGWEQVDKNFRLGYLVGFFDMANMARNLDPDGYIDNAYPLWPQLQPWDWYDSVDAICKEPAFQDYALYGVIQEAALRFKKTIGPPPSIAARVVAQAQEKAAAARKAAGLPPLSPEELAKTAALPIPVMKKPAQLPSSDEFDFDLFTKKKKKHQHRCACPEPAKAAANANAAVPAEAGKAAGVGEAAKPAVQEKAVQEKAVQEKAAQENAGQEKPAPAATPPVEKTPPAAAKK